MEGMGDTGRNLCSSRGNLTAHVLDISWLTCDDQSKLLFFCVFGVRLRIGECADEGSLRRAEAARRAVRKRSSVRISVQRVVARWRK